MLEVGGYDITQLSTLHINANQPTQTDLALAQKYQNFRLLSLHESPEAFASSHDVEITKPLDYFLQRLANPHATYFVATSKSQDSPNDEFWAGLIVLHTLRQPSEDDRESVTSARETNQTASLWLFDLNGTYVHPKARGHGVGLALMHHALQVARIRVIAAAASPAASRVHWSCRVLVDSENVSARRLYEKAGFVAIGTEMYTPHARAGIQLVEKTAICLEYKEETFPKKD